MRARGLGDRLQPPVHDHRSRDGRGQLVAFARSKHLAWLSMRSAGRDQECPGGAADFAEPTCISIMQTTDAFTDAFVAY